MAARSEHVCSIVKQTPSPGFISTRSLVVLTVKFAAKAGALAIARARAVSLIITSFLNLMRLNI